MLLARDTHRNELKHDNQPVIRIACARVRITLTGPQDDNMRGLH